MAELSVQIADESGVTVVRLIGELGLSNADRFQNQTMGLLTSRDKRIVFDLGGLSFIASLGMGELVSFRDGVTRHGCAVVVAGLQQPVRDAFMRARLNEIFPIYDDLATAAAG